MLNSEIAEQVILAIICNYENADAHEIVRKIILRLLQLSDGLKLQKYLPCFVEFLCSSRPIVLLSTPNAFAINIFVLSHFK